MKGKAGLIVGLGAGYVLGTRDGRGRYEQIRQQWQQLINDPRVKEKAAQATDLAKEKAPLVKDKVSDVTSKAGSKVGSGSESRVSTGSGLDDLDDVSTSNTGGFHSADSDDSVASDDVLEEDAIILTPPSPSPLAPGPTDTTSGSGSHG